MITGHKLGTGCPGRLAHLAIIRPGGASLRRVMLHPEGAPKGRGDRKDIHGWSKRSARANTEFLQRVLPEKLPEGGQWVTVTVGSDVPTPGEFKRTKRAWLDVLRRKAERAGETFLLHHVVEFQRRGAPHVHAIVWGVAEYAPLAEWVRLNPGVSLLGQHCRVRMDPRAVVRYVAKHGSRGMTNYQRSPAVLKDAWATESAGRLWGIRGDWEPYLGAENVVEMPEAEWYAVRRRYRRWARVAKGPGRAGYRGTFSSKRGAGMGQPWDVDWLWRGTVVEGPTG